MSDPERFPLRECVFSDLPDIGRIVNIAFAPNVAHQVMFPATVARSAIDKWFSDMNIATFNNPEIHIYKITDAETNSLVAFVKWGYPHTPDPSPGHAKKVESAGVTSESVGPAEVKEEEAGKPKSQVALPEGTNVRFLNAYFGILGKWKQKYIDWKNTYGRQPRALSLCRDYIAKIVRSMSR